MSGSANPAAGSTHWPHTPVHRLCEGGTYFVTAGTYLKQHHFKSAVRLQVLHRGLLKLAADFGWQLEAWAVFPNHYHFVAHSPAIPGGAQTMPAMLKKLHSETAKWLNRIDETPGRQVWYNYRDTKLTYEKSYLARLNYTHRNAVKHGLVPIANQISLVLGGMVREDGQACANKDDLWNEDR